MKGFTQSPLTRSIEGEKRSSLNLVNFISNNNEISPVGNIVSQEQIEDSSLLKEDSTPISQKKNKLEKSRSWIGDKRLKRISIESSDSEQNKYKWQSQIRSEGDTFSVVNHVSSLLPIDLSFQLTQLNLSYSMLKYIPEDLFLFVNLIQLHLNDNLFSELRPFSFVKNLSKLQFLDLSNNKIPYLYDILILGHLKELKELNLLGNPIANIENRPALIQELLFREWRTLKEESNYNENIKDESPNNTINEEVSLPTTPLNRIQSVHTLSPSNSTITLTNALNSTFRSSTSNLLPQSPQSSQIEKKIYDSDEESESETNRKRPNSAIHLSEELLKKRYGYCPSPKGTPQIKKLMEQRPKSAYMKSTATFSNREKKMVAKNNEDMPSTLDMSKYNLKQLQKVKKEKPIIYREEIDDFQEQDILQFEDNPKKLLNSIRNLEKNSETRPFKDSLLLLTDSFKSTSEIIHRLKDIPAPRSYQSYFPNLVTLNGRNISVEEYLMAENEEIFDICKTAPKKVRKTKPEYEFAQDIITNDLPLEEEPTYITNKQDFSKSEELADTLNYIRVNHFRQDISNVSTYSDARYKVRDHKDMMKILDKSCKAEYVEIDDYKNIKGTKKWVKTFEQVSSDLGSINFNDVLRWEHQQIMKRANKLIGSKKKNRSLHVSKHRYENLSFDQVETSMRKSELNLNITTTKRLVKPVLHHNPHQVTEFCKQERMHQRKLAKKKGHEFSQRLISLQVQKSHPEDDIVQFFSQSTKQFSKEASKYDGYNSDDSDYSPPKTQQSNLEKTRNISNGVTGAKKNQNTFSGIPTNFSETEFENPTLSSTPRSMKSKEDRQKNRIERKKELIESKEKITINGVEFEFSPMML